MGRKETSKATPVGEVFRWLRHVYLEGARQIDLASELRISLGYLANLEVGTTNLSEDKAREIAHAVARTPEDERTILLKFQEALVKKKMPEVLEELECRKLRPEEGETPVWAPWTEGVGRCLAEREMTPDGLAEALGADPAYVRRLVAGEIMPTRGDVRRIATSLDQDVRRQTLLAGYLPVDALGLLDEIEMLLETESSGDERAKSLLRAVLSHTVPERPAET